MRFARFFQACALVAILLLAGWNLRQTAVWAGDKPVKVHILYSSDAVGYHEPCG